VGMIIRTLGSYIYFIKSRNYIMMTTFYRVELKVCVVDINTGKLEKKKVEEEQRGEEEEEEEERKEGRKKEKERKEERKKEKERKEEKK
jgi:hypothetical protein